MKWPVNQNLRHFSITTLLNFLILIHYDFSKVISDFCRIANLSLSKVPFSEIRFDMKLFTVSSLKCVKIENIVNHLFDL